jgi:hypothetical protein
VNEPQDNRSTTTEDAFATIFAECSAAVASGRWSLAQCLARYPEHADELRALLQVQALLAQQPLAQQPLAQQPLAQQPLAQRPRPVMRAAAVASLEGRLRQQMRAQARTQPRTQRTATRAQSTGMWPLWGKAAAAVLIAMLMAFGGGAGMVAASADTLPGDALYGFKRWWETVLLWVAEWSNQLPQTTLIIAEVRLDEVQTLAAQGALNAQALQDLADAQTRMMQHNTPAQAAAFASQAYQTVQGANVLPNVQGAHANALATLGAPLTSANSTVTPIPSPTATAMPTLIPTHTATNTATATAMPTATPLFAATATPTQTLRPANTASATPTATPITRTPTATLNLPTLGVQSPTPFGFITTTPHDVPPHGVPPNDVPNGGGPLVGGNATATPDPFLPPPRQTQQSVYMTQTAQSNTTPTASPIPPTP